MFVKDIVEHDVAKPSSPAMVPRPPVAQARGFPIAAHRSKGGSAFARARQDAKVRAGGGLVAGEGRVVDSVPTVGPSFKRQGPTKEEPQSEGPHDAAPLPALTEAEQIRRQVHMENQARVESMSPSEREQEAEELRERFGEDIVELMRRRRAARDVAGAGSTAATRAGTGPRLIRSEQGMGVEGGAMGRPMLEDLDDLDMDDTIHIAGRPRFPAGGPRLGGMDEIESRGSGSGPNDLGSTAEENAARVRGMSQAERDEEMRDLEERFGSALLGRLKATLEKRGKAGPSSSPAASSQPQSGELSCVKPTSAPEHSKTAHEHPTAEPPAKAAKSVHFDDPSPSSPEPAHKQSKFRQRQSQRDVPSQAQLSKYFPDAAYDPKLEWMGMVNPAAVQERPTPSKPSEEDEDANAPRFDLTGAPLTTEAAAKLPTHLGLHHHGASPDLAGYTIGEITHLCYSTVASQRIAMMGVLGRVVRNYRREIQTRPDLAKPTAEESLAEKQGWKEKGETNRDDWVKACREADVCLKAVSVSSSILSSPTRAISVVAAAVDLLFAALGGPWPYLDAPVVTFHPDPAPGEARTTLAWEDLNPRLAELLSSDLPAPTLFQLLRILRRVAVASPAEAEAITPLLPHVIKSLILRPAWPVPAGEGIRAGPNMDALCLLREVIESSRAAAEALGGDALLKFLATGVPEDAASRRVVLEVLRILRVLGRYGMASSLAASARDVFQRLGRWVSSNANSHQEEVRNIYAAYFDLLAIWVTCAIDPHRTTPDHDLTWSQLLALGVVDEALSATQTFIVPLSLDDRDGAGWSNLASALSVLAEYAIGVGINGVRGGAEEKASLLSSLQDMDLLDSIPDLPRNADGSKGFVRALTQIFRLNNTLNFQLVSGASLDRLTSWALTTGDVYLQHAALETARSCSTLPLVSWASSAFELALSFVPGDEPLALGLVDDLLKADWSSLRSPVSSGASSIHSLQSIISALSGIGHKDGLVILRPLLHQSILPSVSDILAPTLPSHLYLKASGTLRSLTHTFDEAHDGLPLSPEWVASPLDELLRSGSSEALSLAPGDWDASEPQIVRATLALTRLAAWATPRYAARSGAILACMKTFMLEHGLQDVGGVSDVFRDEGVAASLKAILDSVSVPLPSPSPRGEESQTTKQEDPGEQVGQGRAGLEQAARSFLGDTPFFQFYQDLVALFEAVSFGDPNFARTLLPPLAMSYAVDYRRLLWAESSALRSLRVPDATLVPLETGDVSAYFHPAETDREVLAAYARALTSGLVREDNFLARVATHHLAGLLWTGKDEDRTSPRVQLLIMVLAQGSDDVLRRLMVHDIASRDGCGVVAEEVVAGRVVEVGRLGGPRAVARLKKSGYAVD